MANTMSGFFNQNAKKVENVTFTLSDRFVDPETGLPYEWEMRPLGAQEEVALRKECSVTTKDRKGRTTKEVDQDKYVMRAVARTVVFPDLRNAELQDSYGVMGEQELLQTMLLSAEQTRLLLQFNKLNGYDKAMDELVDEAQD